jgi:multiple sugar transport system ATP-binding protein
VPEEHAGHHRRSDLIFRSGTERPARGDDIRLDVDLDRILLFAADGGRITSVRR